MQMQRQQANMQGQAGLPQQQQQQMQQMQQQQQQQQQSGVDQTKGSKSKKGQGQGTRRKAGSAAGGQAKRQKTSGGPSGQQLTAQQQHHQQQLLLQQQMRNLTPEQRQLLIQQHMQRTGQLTAQQQQALRHQQLLQQQQTAAAAKPKTHRLAEGTALVNTFSDKDLELHIIAARQQKAHSTPARLKPRLMPVLRKLMEHKYGFIFSKPVDPLALNIADYFTIVTDPMDLGTVKKRLETAHYKTLEQFASDVRLTFANAHQYNEEGSFVHDLAKSLVVS
jgi:hypothetical protein